jgi:hypothetical protein
MKELCKEGFYFKLRDDIEFKHIKNDDFKLKTHFKKMIWYGQSLLYLYKLKLISIKDLLAPIYLSSVPLLTLMALFVTLQYGILLLPFCALFPFSIVKALREGFKDYKSLLTSLLFPVIMVFKSFGLTIGIIKSIIE